MTSRTSIGYCRRHVREKKASSDASQVRPQEMFWWNNRRLLLEAELSIPVHTVH